MQSQNQISTFSGKPKKDNTGKNVLGVVAGTATGYAMFQASKTPLKPYVKSMVENLDKFTPEEKNQLIAEADRMVEESGIKNKGFNGIYLVDSLKEQVESATKSRVEEPVEEGFKEIPKIDFKKMIDGDPLGSILKGGGRINSEKVLAEMDKGILYAFKHGSLSDKMTLGFLYTFAPLVKASNLLIGKPNKRNMRASVKMGCYEPLSNRVFSGSPASLLHEVGHAVNKNSNFLTRVPKRLALLSSMVLLPFVTLNAIFTKKPKKTKKNSKNQSTMDKVRNFTHKHIGLTVAGLSIPLLIEEGLASSRAIKFANASRVLSEATKKQHSKVLKMAYGSYLIGTAIAAATTQAVVSVKDAIQTYKPKKN